MINNYLIAGLMSGTSVDGLDVSILKTDGINRTKIIEEQFFKFDLSYQNRIFRYTENFNINEINKLKIEELNQAVTLQHFKHIKNIPLINNIDYVGFHGQTIYHNIDKKTSIQLGDPQTLSNLLQKKVVFNFRKKDIEHGGHGAPIAPIYHKHILQIFNFKLPSIIINIGGVTNLTFWDGNELIGFDVGPGNGLIDYAIQKNTRFKFDNLGKLASKGKIIPSILDAFFKDEFFMKQFPKSLDKLYFIKKYNTLSKSYHIFDILASLVEVSVKSIDLALDLLPSLPKNLTIVGGGVKNLFMMERLKKILVNKITINQNYPLNPDFIESQLMAYLTARVVNKMPITYPLTTGVPKPMLGGEIFLPTESH